MNDLSVTGCALIGLMSLWACSDEVGADPPAAVDAVDEILDVAAPDVVTGDVPPDNSRGDATDGAEEAPLIVDTWSTFAEGFFGSYCTSCHSAEGMASADYTGLVAVEADAESIRCGTSDVQLEDCDIVSPYAPRFPVGAGPFPADEERARLVDWIEGGMRP